jgi:hypothetical protein
MYIVTVTSFCLLVDPIPFKVQTIKYEIGGRKGNEEQREKKTEN